MKGCVVHIELRLNDVKTEHLLTCSVPGIGLPSLLRVEQSSILFFSAAGNFGVIFDSQLALKEQVNKLTAGLITWRSGGSDQSDSIFLLKPLNLLFLPLFSLDFIIVLLSLQVLSDKTQRVMNCSARLICKTPKSVHVTPLPFDRHWLPVSSRTECIVKVLPVSMLSLVQLLHASLSGFISLLTLFTQLRMLGSFVFLSLSLSLSLSLFLSFCPSLSLSLSVSVSC